MLAIGVFLGIAAHRSDSPIDFSCPATQAVQVLKDLSVTSGLQLKADATVQHDVFVIRASQVSLKDLLQKIADASGSLWVRQGSDFVLTPSSRFEQAQRSRIAVEWGRRIAEAVNEQIADPAYQVAWNPSVATRLVNESADVQANQAPMLSRNQAKDKVAVQRPDHRTSIALLKALGGETIASNLLVDKRIYSSYPNSLEEPLANATEVFPRFIEEQTLFAEAAKEFGENHPLGHGYAVTSIDGGAFMGGDPANGFGRAILKLWGQFRDNRLGIRLTVADAKGGLLGDGYVGLGLKEPEFYAFAPLGDDSPIMPDALTTEMQARCKDSRRIDRISMTMVGSRDDGKSKTIQMQSSIPIPNGRLSPGLAGWLLDPVVRDPLQLGLGGLIKAAAQRRGENLIADLDDRSFKSGLDMAVSKPTPATFLSSEALQLDHEVSEQGGWLMIRPKSLVEARRMQVNRQGLQSLLEVAQKAKLLTVDDFCRFAQTQYVAPAPESIDFEYVKAIDPSAILNNFETSKWPLYTFFGALDADERHALQTGKPIVLTSLAPAAKAALERMMYQDELDPTVTDQTGKEIENAYLGLFSSWTELAPDGISDPSSLLVGSVELQPGAYCYSLDRDIADIRSVGDLALDTFASRSERLDRFAPVVHYDRFAPAEVTNYHFVFHITKRASLKTELSVGSHDPDEMVRPYDQMPRAFQDRFSDELKDLNNFFGGNPVRPGAGKITP